MERKIKSFALFFLVAFVLFFVFFAKQNGFVNKKEAIDDAVNDFYEVKNEVKAPILIYHQIREYGANDSKNDRQYIVSPENFAEQMNYLKENGFTPILIDRLYYYFFGKEKLPEKPVIISFDDGSITQFENAFPILKKNGFVASFFVFTNAMDRNSNYMKWSELKEMSDFGMLIGSHSNLHPYLTRVADKKTLFKEIKGSKDEIERNLNAEATAFAYPFGLYDSKISQMVKDAGYKVARGIANGDTHKQEDLYALRSYFITNDFERFKKIVGK